MCRLLMGRQLPLTPKSGNRMDYANVNKGDELPEENAIQTGEIVPPQTRLRDAFDYVLDKGYIASDRIVQRNMLDACESDEDVLELLDFLLNSAEVKLAMIIIDIKCKSNETRQFAREDHRRKQDAATLTRVSVRKQPALRQVKAIDPDRRREETVFSPMPLFMAPKLAVG